MTTFTAIFKTAAAVTLISGGAALANGNPPVTKYQCWDGSIKTDPSYCPTMTPAQHKTWAEAKGGNATGGAGGNATATGGNAQQAQGQRQGQQQRQSSRNDNRSSQTTNVDASSRYQEAANPVYVAGVTATGNPCAIGGGVGGSSTGRTAGGNFTVLDKACANKMHDLQIIDRTCAYLTQAECRATIAYIEPQARAGMIAAGTIRERVPGVTVSVSRHEQGDGSFTRAMNRAVRVGRDQ